jgi:hypothetical protein
MCDVALGLQTKRYMSAEANKKIKEMNTSRQVLRLYLN